MSRFYNNEVQSWKIHVFTTVCDVRCGTWSWRLATWSCRWSRRTRLRAYLLPRWWWWWWCWCDDDDDDDDDDGDGKLCVTDCCILSLWSLRYTQCSSCELYHQLTCWWCSGDRVFAVATTCVWNKSPPSVISVPSFGSQHHSIVSHPFPFYQNSPVSSV